MTGFAALRPLGSLALLFVVLASATGCGGSSSETPPPLEPTQAPIAVDESREGIPGTVGDAPNNGSSGSTGGTTGAPKSAY